MVQRWRVAVDRPAVLTRFFGEEQLDGERGVEAFPHVDALVTTIAGVLAE